MLTFFQKYGRPNENTPAKWNAEYQDFNAPNDPASNDALDAPPRSETTSKADVLSAPPVAPTGEFVEQDAGVDATPQTNGDKKRKSKHEGETAEEKAERKRRKAEKKEKKAKRKSTGGDDSDASE